MARLPAAVAEAGFDAAHRQQAAWLRALAHPARLSLLGQLAQSGTCVCADLVAATPLAQPTVSQHLKALREAGLIEATTTGRGVCYTLSPTGRDALLHTLEGLADTLRQWQPSPSCTPIDPTPGGRTCC